MSCHVMSWTGPKFYLLYLGIAAAQGARLLLDLGLRKKNKDAKRA